MRQGRHCSHKSVLPTSVRVGRLWLLCFIGVIAGTFAQETPDRILFLHFKYKDDQISLLKTTVAAGTLKTIPHGGPFKLEVELATVSGQVLWTNLVADPSIECLEYEDPEHPGQMTSRVVKSNETEFVVRTPFLPQARRMNFYRAQSHHRDHSTPNPSGPGKPSRETPPARHALGTVTLPEAAK